MYNNNIPHCKSTIKTMTLSSLRPPLRCGALLYVIKNWLPLVLGPLLAMDTVPRLACFRFSLSSSSNLPFGVGYMDLPPRPEPVGSPPWTMKPLMFLRSLGTRVK